MPLRLLGTDEAGYGPNLGPLVVSISAWHLPRSAPEPDIWTQLSSAISQSPPTDGRLHIADSKQVYTPARGLRELERSVLALVGQVGPQPDTLIELRQRLTHWRDASAAEFAAPWYQTEDIVLPVANSRDDVAAGELRLRETLAAAGIELASLRSDVVSERRFNHLADAAGSKGALLTQCSLCLVRSLWHPDDCAADTRICCDKHGGRNSYAGPLSHIADGRFVEIVEESRTTSRYRVGLAEFSFEARGERHLAVAVASLVSKYLRELSMLALNQYWCRHCPGLPPTKGYPQDAPRYFAAIQPSFARLGLGADMIWRRR